MKCLMSSKNTFQSGTISALRINLTWDFFLLVRSYDYLISCSGRILAATSLN